MMSVTSHGYAAYESACNVNSRPENRRAEGNMSESEISALLDAHDALVKAYVDSSLTFSEFVSAYGDFPHNYALVGDLGIGKERGVLRLFGRRIAFHLRVSGVLSGLRSADDPADISHRDANRFLPAVGLKRIRELVARYPDFKAEPDFGSDLEARTLGNE
jgi:hypothetical protein